MPWAPSDPLCKLTQDTQIGINRRLVEFGETRLVITLDPLLRFHGEGKDDICWLGHCWSLLPTKFSAATFPPSFFAASLKYERAVRCKQFVCAENWQQKAASAASFLLRVSVAGKLRKGKRKAACRRKWSVGGESKQTVTLHFMSASRISDMREADMKCKVVVWLLPFHSRRDAAQISCHLHSFPIADGQTHSRKLVAEGVFCGEFTSLLLHVPGYFFTNY